MKQSEDKLGSKSTMSSKKERELNQSGGMHLTAWKEGKLEFGLAPEIWPGLKTGVHGQIQKMQLRAYLWSMILCLQGEFNRNSDSSYSQTQINTPIKTFCARSSETRRHNSCKRVLHLNDLRSALKNFVASWARAQLTKRPQPTLSKGHWH